DVVAAAEDDVPLALAHADADEVVLAAGAVDRRGPEHGDGGRLSAHIPRRHLIGHDLRAGVAAAPGVLVEAVVLPDDAARRALAIHADRPRGAEAADAALERRLDEPLRAEHIGLQKVHPAAGRFDLARAVVDHVDAVNRAAERGPLAHIAGHDAGAGGGEVSERSRAAREDAHLVALEQEPLDEMAAEEPRAAGHERLHRVPPRPICSHTMSSTRTPSRPASPLTGAGRPSSMLR